MNGKKIHEEAILRPERFQSIDLGDKSVYETAFDHVLRKVDEGMKDFASPFIYPGPNSVNGRYEGTEYYSWTNSFWTGLVWLCYEMTGDDKYRSFAEKQIEAYYDRRMKHRIETDNHDIGFVYTLSCTAACKLTGNEAAKQLSLQAAELLADRFLEKAGVIQTHGSLDDPELRGNFIVDCSMNVPILFWANQIAPNQRCYHAGYTHMKQVMKHSVRESAAAYHLCKLDDRGLLRKVEAGQGWSIDGCWSRGQSWLMYGFPLAYRYTGDDSFIDTARKVSHYFLNRLPEDDVCCWDLCFTDGSELRDSSAAAIASCGLLELAGHLKEEPALQELYRKAAYGIIRSLSENYTTAGAPQSNGILAHAVYSYFYGMGVDESCIWGDYFYAEALVRILRDWKSYW